MKIKIIIADEHPTLIAGITFELSKIPTIEIVGTTNNSTGIFDLLEKSKCDILITDYIIPGGAFGDGMTMLSLLLRRYPDLKIIVFTDLHFQIIFRELVKLGVHSALSKTESISHLIFAVHAIHAGSTYFLPQSHPTDNTHEGAEAYQTQNLSRREAEVIRLYVSGQTINEIASQFNRRKQTISTQKSSAMRKLGIKTDIELIRLSHEVDLVIKSHLNSHPDIKSN